MKKLLLLLSLVALVGCSNDLSPVGAVVLLPLSLALIGFVELRVRSRSEKTMRPRVAASPAPHPDQDGVSIPQVSFDPRPFLNQDNWWVDYANGDNKNDGLTQATALKDTGEVRRRWCGGLKGVRPQLPTAMLVIQAATTIKRSGTINTVPNPFSRTATGQQTVTDLGVADWTSDVDHLIHDTATNAVAYVTIGGSPATLSHSHLAVDTTSLASLNLSGGLAAAVIAAGNTYDILNPLVSVYLGSDSFTRCVPSFESTVVPVPKITVHIVSPSTALADPFSDPILSHLADVDLIGQNGTAAVVLYRLKAAPQNLGPDWAYVNGDGAFLFSPIGSNIVFAECDLGAQALRAGEGVFLLNCIAPFLHGDDLQTFSSNLLGGYARLNQLIGSRWVVDQDFYMLGARILQSAGSANGLLIGNFGRFLNGSGATIVFQESSVDGGRGSAWLFAPVYDGIGVVYGTTSGADIAHITGGGRFYASGTAAATFVYDGGATATFQLGGTASGYGFNATTGVYVGPTTYTVQHIDAALAVGTGFGGVAIDPKTDNRILVSGNR